MFEGVDYLHSFHSFISRSEWVVHSFMCLMYFKWLSMFFLLQSEINERMVLVIYLALAFKLSYLIMIGINSKGTNIFLFSFVSTVLLFDGY